MAHIFIVSPSHANCHTFLRAIPHGTFSIIFSRLFDWLQLQVYIFVFNFYSARYIVGFFLPVKLKKTSSFCSSTPTPSPLSLLFGMAVFLNVFYSLPLRRFHWDCRFSVSVKIPIFCCCCCRHVCWTTCIHSCASTTDANATNKMTFYQ